MPRCDCCMVKKEDKEMLKNSIKIVFTRSVGYDRIIYFSYSMGTFHDTAGANAKKEQYNIDYYSQVGILFIKIIISHKTYLHGVF